MAQPAPHVLARHDLISFVRLVRPDLKIPKQWVLMASWLEKLEAGKETRLIIELLVKHGKSELCHKLYPAWYLGRNPTKQIMSATHKDSLPACPQKDQSDALSQYLGWLRRNPTPSYRSDPGGEGSWHKTLERAARGYTDDIEVF